MDADEKDAFAGTFTSKIGGGTIVNPVGPMEMHMLQEHHSIGFVFESPEVSMTVSEPNYADPQGRNVVFTEPLVLSVVSRPSAPD